MLLLNLFGILAIGSFSLEVAVANDDLDDTLNQALFLVKLLKSDFAQILRVNDEVTENSTDDENSTCSLPSEVFNSTMAMNETQVTVSQVTPSTPATPPPSTPATLPPSAPNVMPPGAPMMMPYVSWPPMAMGYPPTPGRQNFPDENYRFPYRRSRRRMMPDYYYFDPPAQSRGNFRRFGNDPTDDLGNTPATSQAQTTSSLSPATSEATTVHVEDTTASTTSLSTTLTQPSILPTTKEAILRTTISTNHTILASANSAKQSIPANPSKQTNLATITKSILLTATSTKQSSLPTTKEPNLPTIKWRTKHRKRVGHRKRVRASKATSTKQSSLPTTAEPDLTTNNLTTRRTKHRKRVGHGKRVHVSKATTTVISNNNEKHLKVSQHHLRKRTHNTATTEKLAKDDFEMSQVASELKKELEGTNAEDVHIAHADDEECNQLKLKATIKTTKRTTTTMKVFLQGSSRIPIPFPENNGFCHFHPDNALCSTT